MTHVNRISDPRKATLSDPVVTSELLRQMREDNRPTLPPPSYRLAPQTEEQEAYAWLETL